MTFPWRLLRDPRFLRLSPPARLLLFVLFALMKGGTCFVSSAGLSRLTGLSWRRLSRYVGEVVNSGLIVRTAGSGRGRASEYKTPDNLSGVSGGETPDTSSTVSVETPDDSSHLSGETPDGLSPLSPETPDNSSAKPLTDCHPQEEIEDHTSSSRVRVRADLEAIGLTRRQIDEALGNYPPERIAEVLRLVERKVSAGQVRNRPAAVVSALRDGWQDTEGAAVRDLAERNEKQRRKRETARRAIIDKAQSGEPISQTEYDTLSEGERDGLNLCPDEEHYRQTGEWRYGRGPPAAGAA